jgi:hypothetical protein
MTDWHDRIEEVEDDALSMQEMLQTLWAYRRTMFISLSAIMLVAAAALLLAYVAAPKERVATLNFRLMFDGADRDEFPNGTKFSPTEIASTPVLMEVYRINELERYLKFDEFKASVFVLQGNAGMDVLALEYQAKLSDPRLTSVDRERIETEFRRKREGLKSAENSLSFRRSERAQQLPGVLLNKVLQDTLFVWAEHAATRKGAIRYDIPVPSSNAVTKELVDAADYAIGVDMLRSTGEGLLLNIARITELPGASAVRLGDEQISLADVQARLEDILRFILDPLLTRIRANGLSRDPRALEHYWDGRLRQARLDYEEAAQRLQVMQEALRTYVQRGASRSMAAAAPGSQGERGETVMPQLSQSFIDRLVDLSEGSADIDYRQKLTNRIIDEGATLAQLSRQVQYYEMTRSAFNGAGTPRADLVTEVTATTNEAYRQIAVVTDQIGALFERISEQNLNPNSVLYTLTGPFFVTTQPSLTLRTILFFLAVTLFVGIIAIPLICLAAAHSRSVSRPGTRRITAETRVDSSRATGV